MQIWVEYEWHFAYATQIKSINPKNPMDMGMDITIQNPIGVDMSMGMIFGNRYECGCGSASLELAPSIPNENCLLHNFHLKCTLFDL